MKLYRISNMQDNISGHILKDILPGEYIYLGGLSFLKPGDRSHTNDGTGGVDYHVHTDCEAFVIFQGKGNVEINKSLYPVTAGDIVIVEPGEDHHIISDTSSPLVTLWCHAGSNRNKNQL